MNATYGAQAVHHRVEQSAEDAGPRDFERAPELALGTSLYLANGRQVQKDGSVAQARVMIV